MRRQVDTFPFCRLMQVQSGFPCPIARLANALAIKVMPLQPRHARQNVPRFWEKISIV
jgi:hypothetical protein